MDVPIKCPECQPGPNPIGPRLTKDLGSSSGQRVACLVKVVHFEQGNDAGAAAPVELEIAVAWAEQLDPVVVPRRELHRADLVESHLQAQGLGEELDRSRVVADRDASQTRLLILMALKNHTSCVPARPRPGNSSAHA